MENFLSMMGFACNGYVFLFKDVVFSDSLGSKMELGEIWPQILPYLPPFATKFGPINIHKLPTYFLNIMLERKKTIFQHTAQNTASRRDTHTAGTSGANPRLQKTY
jgi:hypothetical protein